MNDEKEASRKKAGNGSESPRAKALRLANQRVNGALGRLRQIGNLGSGYELTDADKEKICDTIFPAVHEMKRRLEGKTRRDKFSL